MNGIRDMNWVCLLGKMRLAGLPTGWFSEGKTAR